MKRWAVALALVVLVGVAQAAVTAQTEPTVTDIRQLLYQYQPGAAFPFRCDGSDTTSTRAKFVYDVRVNTSDAMTAGVNTIVDLNGRELWTERTINDQLKKGSNRFYTYQHIVGDGLYRFETRAGGVTVSCEVRKLP